MFCNPITSLSFMIQLQNEYYTHYTGCMMYRKLQAKNYEHKAQYVSQFNAYRMRGMRDKTYGANNR